MKNRLIFVLLSLVLLMSCSPNIILRKTYSKGDENIPTWVREYNLKSKTITSKAIDLTEVKSFELRRKDYRYFHQTLKEAEITNNFCWNFTNDDPNYTLRYEIILDVKKSMPTCAASPINQEIYESYVKITDSLNKLSNQ